MDVLKNYMAAPVVESLARKYQDAKGGVFVDTHTILILPSLQGRAPRVICPVQNQYSVPEHLFWRGPQILIIPTRREVMKTPKLPALLMPPDPRSLLNDIPISPLPLTPEKVHALSLASGIHFVSGQPLAYKGRLFPLYESEYLISLDPMELFLAGALVIGPAIVRFTRSTSRIIVLQGKVVDR